MGKYSAAVLGKHSAAVLRNRLSLCGRGALPRATPAKMSIAQFDIKIITIIIVINLIIIKP